MKTYKIGDKSKAICENCGKIVDTTFLERAVPIRNSKQIVSKILVSVCNKCDMIVGIPQQSVPKINKEIFDK